MNRRHFFQLLWGALAVAFFAKKLESEPCPATASNDETKYCPKRIEVLSHEDPRPCVLSVADRELLVSCTCGRKKYYMAEEKRYAFICNGIVILKYHRDSVPPDFFQEPS